MRRIAATVVGALVLTAITACSGVPSVVAEGPDCGIGSGNASSVVDSTGDLGEAPEVTFPTPLVTDGVQKSVLIHGDSAPLREGQPVILEATILSGADGSVLQQTGYAAEGGSLFTVGDDQLPALGEALECATLGSRIAVVASAADATSGGQATGQESVVYVVDVLRAFHSRADGANQVPQSGMPSVVTAPDGRPGVTVPNETAPTDFRKAVLKQGDGKKVGDDDLVVAKVNVVNWDTREAVSSQSSWPTGSAQVFNLAQDADAIGQGLVATIRDARVGSQVLSVVPPNLAGTGEQAAPADATLVYVVDILGTIG